VTGLNLGVHVSLSLQVPTQLASPFPGLIVGDVLDKRWMPNFRIIIPAQIVKPAKLTMNDQLVAPPEILSLIRPLKMPASFLRKSQSSSWRRAFIFALCHLSPRASANHHNRFQYPRCRIVLSSSSDCESRRSEGCAISAYTVPWLRC